ncbi:tyrosine-type recombinase/integrase [Stenotrophobium rhamnosiphilum]|uniref:Site-specific integrase n=1 Tax=Stenotrophobium rhamnosiphilum TaxID=2029166 RepID=A0A2T5ML60_9GAMM|nr:site-specific integrase [Stenotrophobium rhamnosiphilum]PTU33299.1 site-specific integrase [Stenotrophobium rhamnosiphilum]
MLEWFNPRLSGLKIEQIDDDCIDALVEELVLSERKPSTVNRYLSLLRAMLNAAILWRWLKFAPKVRQVKDRAKRVRWLTFGEAMRLLTQLPPHLSDMAAFSLETGLRRSNVTGLTWTQVDLDRSVAWIHADQAKGRRAIPVPLSSTACAILRKWILQHHEFVFVYRGRRVIQTNTKAWRLALDRAGIKNFRWHDLRHTWASWHAQNGTPRHILQELGGWSDERMVKNYAHLSVQHLTPHVDQLHSVLRQGSLPVGRIRRIREPSE